MNNSLWCQHITLLPAYVQTSFDGARQVLLACLSPRLPQLVRLGPHFLQPVLRVDVALQSLGSLARFEKFCDESAFVAPQRLFTAKLLHLSWLVSRAPRRIVLGLTDPQLPHHGPPWAPCSCLPPHCGLSRVSPPQGHSTRGIYSSILL